MSTKLVFIKYKREHNTDLVSNFFDEELIFWTIGTFVLAVLLGGIQDMFEYKYSA